MMHSLRDKSVAPVGAILLLAWCSSARAQATSADLRIQRRKELAAQTESQRARLKHNFELFKAMSPDEQDRLRRLDRELKDDARNNQGQLQDVMNRYYDWLMTLTPGQAEDLRRETDPNKREKKIREFLREQQAHASSAEPPQGTRFPKGLSDEDLAAVLDVMEQAMRAKTLSPDEIKELDRKKELARTDPGKKLGWDVYVMELAYHRPGATWPPRWFGPDVLDGMIESISNQSQVRHLRDARQEQRIVRLNFMIWGNIWHKYEQLKPDQESLERFFAELPSAKKDEIMRLTYDQQQQRLTHMFLEKMSEVDPDTYPPPPIWFRPGRGGARGGGFQPRTGAEQPRDSTAGSGKKKAAGKRQKE